MTGNQRLTNFLIESRLAVRDLQTEPAVYQVGDWKYICEDRPDICSFEERMYTGVGLIWTATHHGGFILNALAETQFSESTIQRYIDYCRGKTYAQSRIIGRTISGANCVHYMDVSQGDVFDFAGEETVRYCDKAIFKVIFKLCSRGGRVI